MPRAASLSRFLTAVFIPLCTWGLISTLVVHLVELRSVFVVGGEWRLRQAVLAFSAGVVLLQRLAATEGTSKARAYGFGLGIAITLFAAYHAWAYRVPVSPWLVFLANMACLGVLWWAGYKITEACSYHFDRAEEAAAAEYGILSRTSLGAGSDTKGAENEELTDEERVTQWSERLRGKHPGLVLLYFSLFAIPAFGLGIYLFEPGDVISRFRLGVLLFIYLWCAFALLFLSSLNQLRAYFEKRSVSLPEMVGLTWLALGFLLTTLAVLVAVFLPQPPSLPNAFVRTRVVSVYRGWESRHGVRDTAGGSGSGGGERGEGAGSEGRNVRWQTSESVKKSQSERFSEIDKLGDEYLSDVARNTGAAPEYRNFETLTAAVNESFGDIFDWVLKALLVIVIVCGVFVAIVLCYAFWRGLSEGVSGLRWSWFRRKGQRADRRKKERREKREPAGRRFAEYRDPFGAGLAERDGDALVRYMWEAMLAFCSDYGTPCPEYRTPLEFVGSRPEALEGFEDSAAYLAQTLTYSEFSGREVPPSAIPRLKTFWQALRAHVAGKM